MYYARRMQEGVGQQPTSTGTVLLFIANSNGLTCCVARLVHDVGLEEESPTSPPGARGAEELEGPIKLSSSEEEFPQDELSDPTRSPR